MKTLMFLIVGMTVAYSWYALRAEWKELCRKLDAAKNLEEAKKIRRQWWRLPLRPFTVIMMAGVAMLISIEFSEHPFILSLLNPY